MGIVVFAILAVIAYVAYQLGKYDPQIRGAKGERRVADILRRLPEDEYKVLNNLLVQSRFGTTQIDHVVVSVHGIFVVETKNYSGWIMGSEHGEQWIKNMYGHKYSFRNPLKQNMAHIRALQEILNLSIVPQFYNFVAQLEKIYLFLKYFLIFNLSKNLYFIIFTKNRNILHKLNILFVLYFQLIFYKIISFFNHILCFSF